MSNIFDVIVIGAGAAGLMCSIQAGQRGKSVLLLDHVNKAGKKILMSGGGRCNFTNLHIADHCYQSHNPHFVKSALSRYTQYDFIKLVEKYQIPYYEKTLGQLFCEGKSIDILQMLLSECQQAKVILQLNTEVLALDKEIEQDLFILKTSRGLFNSRSIVIATGGLSIPTLGSTPFAYKVAAKFGLKVWPTKAGLVPLTLNPDDKEKFAQLSGVSVEALVKSKNAEFKEAILFTHRGISGPAILQISSYWNPGELIEINLLPNVDLFDKLQKFRETNPKKQLNVVLYQFLPKRLIDALLSASVIFSKLADCSNAIFIELVDRLQNMKIKPDGTEGYRTAEVTLGGVDCDEISSKTMEVKSVKNLYFIGEALDVTGWLGGYNFQWAWSSGYAAGQAIS
ncbi:MAG: hypothetical protein A3E88_01660 [Legionellales bacterium RIFCSPHIGHO2_12_FULL_35_11]|nr:MAG: hypothetical protein A3E88_01660 [Legionellales bacterium RIFCSPHIGHO2_12_FULL_35_11]